MGNSWIAIALTLGKSKNLLSMPKKFSTSRRKLPFYRSDLWKTIVLMWKTIPLLWKNRGKFLRKLLQKAGRRETSFFLDYSSTDVKNLHKDGSPSVTEFRTLWSKLLRYKIVLR